MGDRYVVLADVVSSRQIDDREGFRHRLRTALEHVNGAYPESLHTKFDIIKGVDEFGGVLDEMAPVYEIVADVLDRIHPAQVRFGIAGGELDVTVEGSVSEMDGPAFHRADALLSEAESEDLFALVETGAPLDALVSNNINLLLILREGRTDHQVKVVRTYERTGTQSAAAQELDIPQQSVSQTLKRADHGRIRRIRETLREALEESYGR